MKKNHDPFNGSVDERIRAERILKGLILDHVIMIDDIGDVSGKASDGQWVIVGNISDNRQRDTMLAYLLDHSTPDTW